MWEHPLPSHSPLRQGEWVPRASPGCGIRAGLSSLRDCNSAASLGRLFGRPSDVAGSVAGQTRNVQRAREQVPADHLCLVDTRARTWKVAEIGPRWWSRRTAPASR
jgi:hypothetical protein